MTADDRAQFREDLVIGGALSTLLSRTSST
jgi:hypothetical protein